MIEELRNYFDVEAHIAPNKGKGTKKAMMGWMVGQDAVLAFRQYYALENVAECRKPCFLWYSNPNNQRWMIRIMSICQRIFTPHLCGFRVRTGHIERIRIMGYAVDTDMFAPRPAQPHDGVRVLYIGHLSKGKHLVEFCHSLQEKGRKDVTLHTFTWHGCHSTEYVDRFLELDNAVSHPTVKYTSIPDLMHWADVYIDHAKGDAAPDIHVLEAMACGKAVAVTPSYYYGHVPEEWFVPKGTVSRYIPTQYALEGYPQLREAVLKRHSLKDNVKLMAEEMHFAIKNYQPPPRRT